MNHLLRPGTILATAVCAGVALFTPRIAEAEECSNQGVVDACVGLCSVVEGACGALCGAAEETCKFGCNAAEGACGLLCNVADGVCYVGCGFEAGLCNGACIGCCLNPFGCDCDACGPACNNDFDSCTDGCDADCDFCMLDCEGGCTIECDNCRLPCESDCQDLCIPFKKIGESCFPLIEPCEAGAVCWPNAFGGNIFQCFPDETDELFDDEFCLSMYSPELHDVAMNDLGLSQTYGAGGSASVGISDVVEVGTVYGRDGCYGCYISECIGLEANVQVSVFASVGFYDTDINGVRGQSRVLIESAGVELISFATGQVFSAPNFDQLIGTTDCLSFGVGISPISVGLYDCETIVDRVGCLDDNGIIVPITNDPPSCNAGGPYAAECQGLTTNLNLDGSGSSDPDGDSLTYSWSTNCVGGSFDNQTLATPTLTADSPPPCPQNCQVFLTVDDGSDSAGCSAQVTITDTTAPSITCPSDATHECPADTSVAANGSAGGADDCGAVIISSSDSSVPGCGNTETITRSWTATDECAHATSCDQTIAVVDTTDPVLSGVPADETVECDAVPEPATPTATDNCDQGPVISFIETRTDGDCADRYTLTRTWTATDACGHSSSQSQIITVQDTTAPVIANLTADPAALWPPNHKMVSATITPNVVDNCDPAPVCEIVSVSSNEVDLNGDGNTDPDWEVTGSLTLELRAERSGRGNGRVYTVEVTCTDRCGNSSTDSVGVTVGHSRNKG